MRENTARKANPSADFVLGLSHCRKGRTQELEGLFLFRGSTAKIDDVLNPGAWPCWHQLRFWGADPQADNLGIPVDAVDGILDCFRAVLKQRNALNKSDR